MRPSLLFATSLSLAPRGPRGVPRAARASRALHATTTTTRRADDGTIVIAPDGDGDGDASRRTTTASVILCHGLGDTAEGWAEPARYLANKLPHVRFVLPTAPTQPVTLNMGMAMPSWYDIVGLDARSSESCEGLDDSAERILGLLQEEAAGGEADDGDDDECHPSSLDYSRTVLAGFSQGGALALHTGMTQRRDRNRSREGLGLAGVVVMSGYLPRPSQFAVAPGSEDTPILHCHGEEDGVVPVQATDLSRERVLESVRKAGGEGSYEVRRYSGLEHSVSMEELDDVAAFLRRVLPPVVDDPKGEGSAGGTGEGAADPAKMSARELKEAIRRAGLEDQAKGMFDKSELVDLLSRHLKSKL